MKIIQEYIHSKHNFSGKLYYYLNEAQEFFDYSLPTNVFKDICNKKFFSYSYENLLTHDVNKLCNKLKKEFPNIEIIVKENQSLEIIQNTFKINDKLKSLLNFYGYFITNTYIRLGKFVIFVEPFIPKEMTDYLYNECYGVCYHICNKKSTESILKNGLRCKQAEYRYFPKRIYLYCTNKNIKKDDEFKQLFYELTKHDCYKNYDVLKINLNHFNCLLYKDPYMKYKGAVFTYNNIPASLISKTKITME